MSNYKVTTLCFIVALIFFFFSSSSSLTSAARHEPAFPDVTPMKNPHGDVEASSEVDQQMEESCEGIGEEECLMRRTLAAHIDYIYTQKAKP